MRTFQLAIAVWVVIAGSVQAAEVALRANVEPTGQILYLGDIADLAASSDSELANLVTIPLLPAPAEGSERFLRPTEVRDLLAVRGVDTSQLRFTGAAVVRIGRRKTASAATEPATVAPAQHAAIEGEVRMAIDRYLQLQSGHGNWQIELSLPPRVSSRLAALTGSFAVDGGRSPWTGLQQFTVQTATGDEVVEVRATVQPVHTVAYAVRDIARGDLIGATDVELRRHVGKLPTDAVIDLGDVVGTEARRAIPADAMLLTKQVRQPVLVRRGETVSVFARTAGISVRALAVARQDGARGELVQVETLDGGERFAASVTGLRELQVFTVGARATDFASLPTSDSLRR